MRFTALGLFAAAVAVSASLGGAATTAAPVPKHLMKAEEPDLQAMQGRWNVTGYTLGGQPIGPDLGELTVEFRGGTIIMTAAKTSLRTTATIKLEPKANPPRLGWSEAKATDLNGEPVKNEGAEKPWTMIYKLEADTLVLAANISDQTQPPKEFGGKESAGVLTMTLTRAKK